VPVLTALKPTRQRGRFAVHVDGAFAFAVSEAFVARNGLHEGRLYTEADYEALRGAARSEAALTHAYRLLAHRLRSEAELRRRLHEKGHTADLTDALISRLTEEGLVDDRAFARAFVSDKVKLSGWGRERIARDLGRAGLSDEIVQAAVAHLEEADEYERAMAALGRHGPPRPPLDKARKRAYDFLSRRGFASPIAYRAVSHWLAGEPPTD
jgi:regulatory protein